MSSIEDQINEPVHGYDDDDDEWDPDHDAWEKLRNERDEYKAEIARLKIEIKELRDELERYNPPSALRPPTGWVPMLSDSGHYWGCPTQTGGKCDCADLDKAEPVGGLVFQQPQATVGPLMSEHCHTGGVQNA